MEEAIKIAKEKLQVIKTIAAQGERKTAAQTALLIVEKIYKKEERRIKDLGMNKENVMLTA